ncbi:FtsX-like permease family protein [Streptacidiphilus sp. N1-3]|uniref:FtsX-like permease family protein n=1 Tax=Streptacidiphilus alkalitolerans TaxID=3342712 RepID=A0ABV6X9Y5_9ACTN
MAATIVRTEPSGRPVRRPPRRLPPPLRRSAQHGLVLTAAALTVLLAGTVLSALAALAGFAVDAGTVDRVSAQPEAQVQFTATYAAPGLAVADRDIRAAVARSFGPVSQHTYLGLVGQTPLVVAGTETSPVLLHPVAVQGAAAHGVLVTGSWPAGAGDPSRDAFLRLPAVPPGSGGTAAGAGPVVDAAVPQQLALRLRLGPGSVLRLTDSYAHRVTVRVSGVFRPSDSEPGFWEGAAGNPTDAPALLVLAPGPLNGTAAFDQQIAALWNTVPDFSRLRAGDLPGLAQRVTTLTTSDTSRSVFHGADPALPLVTVNSSLPSILDRLGGSVVVARSALYLPAALLAVLALTTLVLTARQLAAHRQNELVLQQTRGAGGGRLLRAAGLEWLVIVLPTAVAAPFLAAPLLHGLHGAGVLQGPLPGSTLRTEAWGAVALAVLVHGAAALLPVLRAVTGRDITARLRARGARAAAAQQFGADLALLAVAVLGYLQLRHYRSTVTLAGTVDPVLVLVPVVAVGAASVLLLRLLPLASRLLDAFGRRSRGLVLPLAGWQISRRSGRNAGPVVLMCLAVTVGALATTALACLDALAQDQAEFTVGAAAAVRPATGAPGYPDQSLHARLQALPGVTGVNPVTLNQATSSGDSTAVGLIGIDTTATAPGRPAPPLPTLRQDLAGPHYAADIAALAKGIPPGGLPLPGRPAGIDLDLAVTSSAVGGGVSAPTLTLTVVDADGQTDRITAVPDRLDGTRQTLRLTLPGGARSAYPLTLAGIALTPAADQPAARFGLTVYRIGGDGWADALPAGNLWFDRTGGPGQAARAAAAKAADCVTVPPPGSDEPAAYPSGVCDLAGGAGTGAPLLRAEVASGPPGQRTQGTGIVLVPAPSGSSGEVKPVPVLADDSFVAQTHLRVGDLIKIGVGLDDSGLEQDVDVQVVGTVHAIPGVGTLQANLLVDQRALAAAELAGNIPTQRPGLWWLAGTEPAADAAAVARDPMLGTAVTTDQAAAQQRADPFRFGMREVLALCRLLAPAFAVIGFTVHVVITTRERRREFALLRAMGTRSRRLATLLWLEQIGVTLFAVLPGALLGVGLAAVILPLVTVDDAGARPYPPLRIDVPWLWVALTALATAGAICLVVMTLSRLLARVDLVRTLRAGEDS